MPPIVPLYSTFGSSSTARHNDRASRGARLQLTSIDERLEEWDDTKSEYGSDISKEDADVTSALIPHGGALGEPETKKRFSLFSTVGEKGKEQDLDAIATQVCFTKLGKCSLVEILTAVRSPVFLMTPTWPSNTTPTLTGKTSTDSTPKPAGHGERNEPCCARWTGESCSGPASCSVPSRWTAPISDRLLPITSSPNLV